MYIAVSIASVFGRALKSPPSAVLSCVKVSARCSRCRCRHYNVISTAALNHFSVSRVHLAVI